MYHNSNNLTFLKIHLLDYFPVANASENTFIIPQYNYAIVSLSQACKGCSLSVPFKQEDDERKYKITSLSLTNYYLPPDILVCFSSTEGMYPNVYVSSTLKILNFRNEILSGH